MMSRGVHFFILMLVGLVVAVLPLSVLFVDNIESAATVVSTPPLFVISGAPNLSAPIFRVFDMDSGTAVVSVGADKKVPIASVTKLFTAVTLEEVFELKSTTTILWSDLVGGGAAGKLVYGNQYSYQDLLFPLLLESSNDAATTLVRSTEGELVVQMNNHARALGATTTTFSDASGLSDANVSTALDLELLLRDAYTHQPHVFDITTLPQYIGVYTGWLNNNPVAKQVGYRGGKHGYTPAAGRTLVAIFDETIEGKQYRLGYIILGSHDLVADFEKLRRFINTSASPT